MRPLSRNLVVFFTALSIVILAGTLLFKHKLHDGPASLWSRDRLLMGTLFSIKASGVSRGAYLRATDDAFNEGVRLEEDMSEYRPGNPLSLAIRHAGLLSVEVSEDTAAVTAIALAVSAETEGLFDITFRPLGTLWDVGKRTTPPREEEIERAKKLVDYRKVSLNGRKLFLGEAGMSCGFGGIAKGYAAGRMAEILRAAGIRNFIINAGGDLYCAGSKGVEPWTCGIRDPDNPERLIRRYAVIKDCAIATSGDYERFFIYQGRRYHHIIDPRTGYPAQDVRSVTVFAADPAVADAYATAFFILGFAKSAAVVARIPGLAFVMIESSGNIVLGGPVGDFVRETEE
ncbi:MAG: FAD:protein FMN transferase [Deltaproteobacteria bacterium]|nr:FAD:protein FMN transferase [Deltaproteobacteria bacterium]